MQTSTLGTLTAPARGLARYGTSGDAGPVAAGTGADAR